MFLSLFVGDRRKRYISTPARSTDLPAAASVPSGLIRAHPGIRAIRDWETGRATDEARGFDHHSSHLMEACSALVYSRHQSNFCKCVVGDTFISGLLLVIFWWGHGFVYACTTHKIAQK